MFYLHFDKNINISRERAGLYKHLAAIPGAGKPVVVELIPTKSSNWPDSQIPECTCSISQNAPFRIEMCIFVFWMEHCGKWNRCTLGFAKLIYSVVLSMASCSGSIHSVVVGPSMLIDNQNLQGLLPSNYRIMALFWFKIVQNISTHIHISCHVCLIMYQQRTLAWVCTNNANVLKLTNLTTQPAC